MSGWQPASPHDLLSVKYSGGKNLSSTACTLDGKNFPFGPSPSPSEEIGARGFTTRPSASTIFEAPHIKRNPGITASEINPAASLGALRSATALGLAISQN